MTCVCKEGCRDPSSLPSRIQRSPGLTYSTWMVEIREAVRQFLQTRDVQQGDGQSEGLKLYEDRGWKLTWAGAVCHCLRQTCHRNSVWSPSTANCVTRRVQGLPSTWHDKHSHVPPAETWAFCFLNVCQALEEGRQRWMCRHALLFPVITLLISTAYSSDSQLKVVSNCLYSRNVNFVNALILYT